MSLMIKEDKKRQIEEIKNLKAIEKTKEKKLVDFNWIYRIIFLTFGISLFMSFVSGVTLPEVPTFVGILLVLLFIIIGVIFDMIGVSVTASDLSVFNSMSSRKVKGAKLAVRFKQNADKVSSFCNDVIGDICGVVSGSCCITIAANISNKFSLNYLICSLIVTAIVSALTIGGKAIGKNIAINKSDIILYRFCLFIDKFWKVK